MINKEYRKSALDTYGEACELCGHRTSLEVHHINYQEHQTFEDNIRKGKSDSLREVAIKAAKEVGFDYWDEKTKQLTKDDSTKNLSVLCGNCHSLCHLIDYGMKIKKALKERR